MKEIILAGSLMMLAASASAQERVSWGNPQNDSVTYVEIVYSDTHFADIIIYNNMSPAILGTQTRFSLTIDDVEFSIHYDAGPGMKPDTVHVGVPPGYVAVPASLTVDEFSYGKIEIHYLTMF
jgi:hypothetical protein